VNGASASSRTTASSLKNDMVGSTSSRHRILERIGPLLQYFTGLRFFLRRQKKIPPRHRGGFGFMESLLHFVWTLASAHQHTEARPNIFYLRLRSMHISGMLLDTVGVVMIAFAALRVHHRVLNERKIDKQVYADMKREQKIGIAGVIFVIIGNLIQII